MFDGLLLLLLMMLWYRAKREGFGGFQYTYRVRGWKIGKSTEVLTGRRGGRGIFFGFSEGVGPI